MRADRGVCPFLLWSWSWHCGTAGQSKQLLSLSAKWLLDSNCVWHLSQSCREGVVCVCDGKEWSGYGKCTRATRMMCIWGKGERWALKRKTWLQTDECDIAGDWLIACGHISHPRRYSFTHFTVRGHPEATAMPVGCHAAGRVVKKLTCWIELALCGLVFRLFHTDTVWSVGVFANACTLWLIRCLSVWTRRPNGPADRLVFWWRWLNDSHSLTILFSFFAFFISVLLSQKRPSWTERRKIAAVLRSAFSRVFC